MHWQVGEVELTKILEAETTGSTQFILPSAGNEEIRQLPWLIPHFATEEGRLKMSIHSLGRYALAADRGRHRAWQRQGRPHCAKLESPENALSR